MDKHLLNTATKADSDMTPGYIYKEISMMTHRSPAVCLELEDFLLKKLQRDNPYVKLKVLKIIKNVSETGKPEFRRAMQRHADKIKLELSYKAPSHVLVGDTPSLAVREEAEACLKVLFAHENMGGPSHNPLELSGRIRGFGPDSEVQGSSSCSGSAFGGRYAFDDRYGCAGGIAGHSGHSGSSPPITYPGTGTSRLQGFGNPAFDHSVKPNRQETLMKNLAGAAIAASKYLPATVATSIENVTGVNLRDHDRDFTSGSWNGVPTFMKTGRRWSGAYKGFDGGFQTQSVRSQGASGHVWGGHPTSTPSFPVGDSTRLGVSEARGRNLSGSPVLSADPGVYESKLVQNLCQPGGARICPPTAALTEFSSKCENLDLELIGILLIEQLKIDQTLADNGPSWQSQLRVLCVLESLLNPQTSPPKVVEGTVDFVSTLGREALESLAEAVPQCKLKTKAILQNSGVLPRSLVSEGKSAPVSTEPSSGKPSRRCLLLAEVDDDDDSAIKDGHSLSHSSTDENSDTSDPLRRRSLENRDSDCKPVPRRSLRRQSEDLLEGIVGSKSEQVAHEREPDSDGATGRSLGFPVSAGIGNQETHSVFANLTIKGYDLVDLNGGHATSVDHAQLNPTKDTFFSPQQQLSRSGVADLSGDYGLGLDDVLSGSGSGRPSTTTPMTFRPPPSEFAKPSMGRGEMLSLDMMMHQNSSALISDRNPLVPRTPWNGNTPMPEYRSLQDGASLSRGPAVDTSRRDAVNAVFGPHKPIETSHEESTSSLFADIGLQAKTEYQAVRGRHLPCHSTTSNNVQHFNVPNNGYSGDSRKSPFSFVIN